jgi:hypothetical protein
VVLVVIAGASVAIEQSHRVVVDAPGAANAASLAAAAGCPDNDTMPYGERCAAFLNISTAPAARPHAANKTAQPAPCPDSDRVPYSASCIAFLKGATETGMRWRATDARADHFGVAPR